MKKYIFILIAFLYSFNANAQMGDLLGTLAVEGVNDTSAIKGVNKMNNAMSLLNFKQELQRLHAEIQVMFIGNYGEAKKSLLYFRGLKGLEWDVVPVSLDSYCVDIKGLSREQCEITKNPEWGMAKTIVNSVKKGDCQENDNHVEMCF